MQAGFDKKRSCCQFCTSVRVCAGPGLRPLAATEPRNETHSGQTLSPRAACRQRIELHHRAEYRLETGCRARRQSMSVQKWHGGSCNCVCCSCPVNRIPHARYFCWQRRLLSRILSTLSKHSLLPQAAKAARWTAPPRAQLVGPASASESDGSSLPSA